MESIKLFIKRPMFFVCLIGLLWNCSGGDFGKNKHTISGIITSIGSCGGGEGFFSGNYECAVKVRTGRGIYFWNVHGQVAVGQTIYKHCWGEKGNIRCFSTAHKYIRKGYDS